MKFFKKDYSVMWKGIAAIMIMCGHIIPNSAPYYIRFFFMGSIWVGVFFFYSGYGLQASLKNKEKYLEKFALKKFKSIYIPFFFAELLYFLIAFVLLNQKNYSTGDIIGYIIGYKLANQVLWYVIEIIIINALFYIVNYNKLNTKIWFLIYGLFLIFSIVMDIGNWWYMSTSCFLIGMYINDTIIMSDLKWGILCIIFIILYSLVKILSCFEFYWLPVSKNVLIIGIQIIIIPIFIFLLIGLTERFIHIPRWQYIGKISYEIYLYHMLVAEIIGTIGSTLGKSIQFFMIIICTLYISFIANKVKILLKL